MATFDTVQPGDWRWVWEPFIVEGELSSTSGDGEMGKGLTTRDVAYRLSRGFPPPPWDPFDPRTPRELFGQLTYTLMSSLEDNPSKTTVRQLMAAGGPDSGGADLSFIENMRDGESPRASSSGGTQRSTLTLPRDFGYVSRKITELNKKGRGPVRLWIIDPWMSSAETTVSFNQQMRMNLLDPLAEMAVRHGIGIWIINHLNRGRNAKTIPVIERIAGSVAFTQKIRANSVVQDDPADPEVKVLQTVKNNLAAGNRLGYRIRVADGEPYIQWADPPVDMTSDTSRLDEALLHLLEGQTRPVSPQELAAFTSLSYDTVLQLMSKLANDGQVHEERGGYVLQQALLPATPNWWQQPEPVGVTAVSGPGPCPECGGGYWQEYAEAADHPPAHPARRGMQQSWSDHNRVPAGTAGRGRGGGEGRHPGPVDL